MAGWQQCLAQSGLSQHALFHVLAALHCCELDVCVSNTNLKSCVEAEQDSNSPGPLPWKTPIL